MSEYQYYEFRAIDRPLSPEEYAAVNKLSSRVDLSPTHAIFVYNYSDFPSSAETLLAQYFDAMLYMTNWGSYQLMFRFPKSVIDLKQVEVFFQPAFVEEFMSFRAHGAHLVLNIEWLENEAEWGWAEGKGWLPRLMSLRDDILGGDYRLLYLAWLKAVTLEPDVFDDVKEPPVPPGLRRLSTGLQAFIELFEVDEHLVSAVAESSGYAKTVSEAQLKHIIGQLSREVSDAWLVRLAQGEAQLSNSFNQTLFKMIKQTKQTQLTRRTISNLYARAEDIQKEAQAKHVAAVQAIHLKRMEMLARQESQLWHKVIELIANKTGKSYDQAVAHLKDLRDLAKHQKEETKFQASLNKIYVEYGGLSALLKRLRKAGLYELAQPKE